VQGWVLFDDLDPSCLTGGISMQGVGFSRLWDLCDDHGLTVIADVHTHPGPGVGQSRIDAANPMIAQPGHVALIIPNHARAVLPAPRIGVHIYRGSRRWDPVSAVERDRHLIIRRLVRPARRIVHAPRAT
jgi:proteasome lid subunit RPN8/RPN11